MCAQRQENGVTSFSKASSFRSPSSSSPVPASSSSSSSSPSLRPAMSTEVLKVACNGSIPAARWGHASFLLNLRLYVFAGTGNWIHNDLHEYNPETRTWRVIECQSVSGSHLPPPRFGHSGTLLEASSTDPARFVVIGGRNENKHFQDLWILDLPSFTWRKPANSPAKTFESRMAHTAMLVPDKGILLFGGHGAKQSYFNDVYLIDTDSFKWTRQCADVTVQPCPRGGHAACILGRNQIVFGGFDGAKYFNDLWELNTDTWTWREIKTTGAVPTPRSGHCMIVVGRALVVLGGCDYTTAFLNDVYFLDLDTFEWHIVLLKGAPYSPRFRHTCNVLDGKILMFGGTCSGILLNDLYQIDCSVLKTPKERAQEEAAEISRISDVQHKYEKAQKELELMAQKLAETNAQLLLSIESQKVAETEKQALAKKVKTQKEKRRKAEVMLKEARESSSSHAHLLQKLKEEKEDLDTRLQSLKDRSSKELKAKEEDLEKSYRKIESLMSERKEQDIILQDTIFKFTKHISELNMRILHLQGEQLHLLKPAEIEELEEINVKAKNNLSHFRTLRWESKDQAQQDLIGKLKAQLALLEEKEQSTLMLVEKEKKEAEQAASALASAAKELEEQQSAIQKMRHEAALLKGEELDRLNISELDMLEAQHTEILRKLAALKKEKVDKEMDQYKRAQEQLRILSLCVVCLERNIEVVLVPCGHRSLCVQCSEPLTKCPMCRADVQQKIKTY